PEALLEVRKRGGIVAATAFNANRLRLLPDADVRVTEKLTNEFTNTLARPGTVGIGVEETAAVLVKGRDIRTFGEGEVVAVLAEGAGRPAKLIEWKPGSAADFTTLRKAALARTEAPFPPKDAAVPEVLGGALLIVGGGGMPADITKKFIDLAGGPESL